MLNRSASLAVLGCLAAGLAVAQANQGNGYLFLAPGAQSPGSRTVVYVSAVNNLNLALDGNGPPGGYQVAAKPDGSKFYILGSVTTSALQSVNSTFTQFSIVNGLPTTPNAMAITPNGRWLVAGGAEINIVDTETNAIVAPNIAVSGTVASIAVSRDSNRAWVLANAAFGSVVSTIDLTTRQRVGNQLFLSGGATGITLSPQGRLYVTAVNRIYEINADAIDLALTTNGEVQTAGTLGPLKFTPDGATAYCVNATPSVGGSILKFTVASKTVTSWPPFSGGFSPLFSDVLIAGNNRVFAYSAATTSLWDVTPTPFGASLSALGSVTQIQNVLAAAVSNEVPDSRYVFLVVGNINSATVHRIDLSTNTLNLQVLSVLSSPSAHYAYVPLQTGAANFYLLNNFQVLDPGQVSAPLVARVLDAANRPVFNVATAFSSADPTRPVQITTPGSITDSEGYVQTTVTAPTTPGTYSVNLAAGNALTTFTLSVRGEVPGGGGGGGGGGPVSRVRKVSGDGQIVPEFTSVNAQSPMTVLVTDLDGKPLADIPVSFTVTTGQGSVQFPNVSNSDANGLAFALFSSADNPPNVIFQTSIVTAATQFGSVDFYITTYKTRDPFTQRVSVPEFAFVKPEGGLPNIAGASGQLVNEAIIVRISAAAFPQIGHPIPNIGIRITEPGDLTRPGAAVCEGNHLSDSNGLARCNMRMGCQVGSFGINILMGEAFQFPGFVTISPGTASKIAIVTGNNQSVRGGELAPITLTAEVTDGCGRQIAGASGAWRVVSGSATLEQTSSVSDSNGRLTTRVRMGQTPGGVVIEVSLENGQKVTFNLTNEIVVASLTLVSGNNQSVIVNQQFPQPLVFAVRDINNNPVTGAQLVFAVLSGSATPSPASVTTDAQGRGSTTVIAGSIAGLVTIQASYAGFTATATLTVRPPGPSITAESFVDAAGESPGLAVCGLGLVKGAGLAPGLTTAIGPPPFGPLPYAQAGVSMTANGIPVPIHTVSNVNNVQQVIFQTPCELAPGPATFVVTVSGTSASVSNVQVVAVKPGLFTFMGPNNRLYGAVIRADGTYVTPSNFLRRGERSFIVVTGLGQVTPATTTNSAGRVDPPQNVNVPVIIGLNNAGITATSAVYLPGSIGVYLVEFTVPLDAAPGVDQPLTMAVQVGGQFIFGNAAFLPGVQ
jgi:uncharacterized protein (TIGR03437 family)